MILVRKALVNNKMNNINVISYDGNITGEASGIEGFVHSVFKSAVSMKFDNRLVTIIHESAGQGPGFIMIDNGIDLRTMGFSPGMPAVFNMQKKVLKTGVYDFSFRNARRFSSKADFERLDTINIESVIKNREFFKTFCEKTEDRDKYLNSMMSLVSGDLQPGETQDSGGSCVLPVWRKHASGILDKLSESIQKRNEDSFSNSIGKLVGLGWGLTPGGDDFIIGMLSASALTAKSRKNTDPAGIAAFTEISIKKSLPGFLCKTGFISGAYLEYTLENRFTQYLTDFLYEFLIGDLSSNPGSVVKLRERGATSGLDMMAGVIFASMLFFPS